MKSEENLFFSLSSEFLSAQALNATVNSRQAPPRRELDRLSRVFEHGMYQSSLSLTEHVSSWDDPQPSEKYCDIADHMDADCRTRLTTGARAPTT
ncbi:unnamed protein product [Brassica oleracea]